MSSRVAHNRLCPDVLSHRWAPLILQTLSAGTLRFTEIHTRCPSVNTRTLTRRLRELQSAGIISRQSYDESPPRVEYTLTENGHRILLTIEDPPRRAEIAR
jgi:DNA-binding HxlR family transcriptional regulator